MRNVLVALCGLVCVSLAAHGDGPADRVANDPHAVSSASAAATAPLPVEALLTTTRVYGVAHSNDGRKLAYTSNASGRLNLWTMNADGTGAHQLVTDEDRQIGARFTRDDSAVVYSQDRGGNEYYDIYVAPVSGGEPRNLTNTPDVSETVDEFSPDGKLLAIGVKQKLLSLHLYISSKKSDQWVLYDRMKLISAGWHAFKGVREPTGPRN